MKEIVVYGIFNENGGCVETFSSQNDAKEDIVKRPSCYGENPAVVKLTGVLQTKGEIVHENTDKMVCPYCGVRINTYGWDDELQKSRIVKCSDCDKIFTQRNSTRAYTKFSTKKLPCANGEGDHEWSHWIGGVERRVTRICKNCKAIDSKALEAK